MGNRSSDEGLPTTGGSMQTTVTCSAVPNAVVTSVVWVEPPLALMLAGAPAVLVRLKLIGVAYSEYLDQKKTATAAVPSTVRTAKRRPGSTATKHAE